MLTFSNIKAKISFAQVYWLILAFFSIRFLSFVLRADAVLQGLVVITAIVILVCLFQKNWQHALLFLIAEYLLGGVGHFFELSGISLRTLLTVIFLMLYLSLALKHKELLKIPKNIVTILSIFFTIIAIAAFVGYLNHNPLPFIIQDLIPIIFILLILPLYHFWKNEKNKIFFLQLILAWLIGSTIWSMLNFVLFSADLVMLHQDYYNWLRDFALAKITASSPYFWRIVFPEQLLLVPLILIISAAWLKYKNNFYLILLLLSGLIFSLNISRAYILGLLFGLLILKYKNAWAGWLKIFIFNVLIIFSLFTVINIASSAGATNGWEILGLNFGGITAPKTEISTQNRIELLAPIINMIKTSPIIGQGLGQSVINEKINTRHFDWGWLEIWVKWGLAGLLFSVFLLIFLLKNIWRQIKNQALYLGLAAGILAMMLINVTTPALFHVFGILYFIISASWIYYHEQPT
jgi:O-antigen ligase